MGPREAAIYRHEQRKARDPRADIKAAAKLLDAVPESVRKAAHARGETLSVSWVNGVPRVGARRAGIATPIVVGTAPATRTMEQFRAKLAVIRAKARGTGPAKAARRKVAQAKLAYRGTGT
jgi:hypothetical protein